MRELDGLSWSIKSIFVVLHHLAGILFISGSNMHIHIL